MSSRDINIYYKFCGGCNPIFDRNKVYRQLREYFNDYITNKNVECPTLIIINGCHAECVKAEKYIGEYDRVINSKDYLIIAYKSSDDMFNWMIKQI